MKVYRNSCYESMLSNEQLLDIVNAICPMREVAFILSEFFVNSQDVKKVGNFAVKYGHYIMYRIPGLNKVYGLRICGTYMVLCPVNNSPDYALCGIIVSEIYVVPDEYSYVGGVMKVYREKLNYATDSSRIIRDMERLAVVKSIGVRRSYALIVNELSICQSGVERIRKNTIKWGHLTLFRIPSIMEVYTDQPYSGLSSVIYKSKCSSCWKVLVVYFTGLPPRDEYTLIGEI